MTTPTIPPAPAKRYTIADLVTLLQAVPNQESFVCVRTADGHVVLWDGTIVQPAIEDREYGTTMLDRAPST